jgi:hypothetical protein
MQVWKFVGIRNQCLTENSTMNILKWTVLTGVAWIAVGIAGSVAWAQGGGPANLQYTPSPTISPYQYLFSNGNGGFAGLSNYQAFVLPALQQNQLNAQQFNVNSQQNSQISLLQQQLNQVRASTGLGTTGFTGHIRSTGLNQYGQSSAATYLNYSHYYTGIRH